MRNRIIRTARERRLVLTALTEDAERTARAYHDLYQAKVATSTTPGPFESCPTLRCETAREGIKYSRAVLAAWHPA